MSPINPTTTATTTHGEDLIAPDGTFAWARRAPQSTALPPHAPTSFREHTVPACSTPFSTTAPESPFRVGMGRLRPEERQHETSRPSHDFGNAPQFGKRAHMPALSTNLQNHAAPRLTPFSANAQSSGSGGGRHQVPPAGATDDQPPPSPDMGPGALPSSPSRGTVGKASPVRRTSRPRLAKSSLSPRPVTSHH